MSAFEMLESVEHVFLTFTSGIVKLRVFRDYTGIDGIRVPLGAIPFSE